MFVLTKNGDNSPSHTRNRRRRSLEHPLTHQGSVIPREVVSPQSFLPFHQATSAYQRTCTIEHQANASKNPGGLGAGPQERIQKLKIWDSPYCNKSRPSLSPKIRRKGFAI